MKLIRKVGVVGAGTMGSALAQKFAQEGFEVILADRVMSFVSSGLNRIKDTLSEGVQKRIFSEEQANSITENIFGTADLNDLKKCDLIIEAIFENFEAKTELFGNLSAIVDPETIIATNTSSYSVSELAKSVSHTERFVGMHYFYHAAKNRLVEIIPGNKTSDNTVKAMKNFSLMSGKDAIMCKDSYGFVVNRFFVPWLNEAVRLLEEGIASPSEIDAVCMKTFSIGMGPFALMNATGVPIAYHAQKTLERFGELYKTSDKLKQQVDLNKNWGIEIKEFSSIDPETAKCISERMLGIAFLVCSQILDEKICSAVEINRGARIGLKWRRGPIDMMKKYEKNEVTRMISYFVNKYKISFPDSVDEKYWNMEFVKLDKLGDTAVITISRPEDMNALNETIMNELSQKFDTVNSDPDIKTIFITGEGKAFVAGADIKFFVDNIKSKTLNNIVSFTQFGQQVYDKIDKSPKTVVAIVNGLALGGGLELALCCDIILAVPKAVFAFPETGIGIYPGLGGTQRTQKRIGKNLTKYLIYTGDFVNASEAEKIGLVDSIIKLEDIQDVIGGAKHILVTQPKEAKLDEKYHVISKYFESYPISAILQDSISSDDQTAKLTKKIKQKAPLALKTAEKLIDEVRGCESELEELTNIFSTSDALLGLSSIGKKVQFQGK